AKTSMRCGQRTVRSAKNWLQLRPICNCNSSLLQGLRGRAFVWQRNTIEGKDDIVKFNIPKTPMITVFLISRRFLMDTVLALQLPLVRAYASKHGLVVTCVATF